jgi:hypothetical protein
MLTAKEKVSAVLSFLAIGILAASFVYILWASGRNLIAFTGPELPVLLVSSVGMLGVSLFLTNGRPILRILRQRASEKPTRK